MSSACHDPTITRRQLLGLPATEVEEQRQDDTERPLIYFTAEDGEIVLKPADSFLAANGTNL